MAGGSLKKQDSSTSSLNGLLFGFLGVLSFSLTLPATRAAVSSIDATIVGLGRGLVAAMLAAVTLLIVRQPRPSGAQFKSLALIAAGVVFGFPFFSSWAMQHVPASHGAVVLGILPLATALAGRLLTHERPSFMFWLASAAGSIIVVSFALRSGGGNFHPADFALLIAVALAALGYAEGGRLAKEIGGWQVICWALLLAAPVLALPVGFAVWKHGFSPTRTSLIGFSYVSIVSMFLGFFAWYRGMSEGGVARVSQLQLIQPFLTLGFSALLLHEHVGFSAGATAGLVAASIMASRRAGIAISMTKA